MKIFDKSIEQAFKLVQNLPITKLVLTGNTWEIIEKNAFLMERDTALELGGYPEESINLILPTTDLESLLPLKDGIYCIGNPDLIHVKEKKSGLFLRKKEDFSHISFGKLVFIETEEISAEDMYAFTQEELLTDSRIRMKEIMLRQSPAHYNINLRIGKNAINEGFDARTMAETIYQAFHRMKHVKKVIVILLLGEIPKAPTLYKELLPVAEKGKEITLTLNHIFDGINMDCGHCNVKEICNEIEGMRELHRRRGRVKDSMG